MDRPYCSVQEVLDDLSIDTRPSDALVLSRIEAASQWIEGKHALGANFIPITRARRYDGPGGQVLFIDPLTTVTSIVDDATTLSASDYLLYPRSRHFDPSYGPYTRIEIDPDAASLTAWTRERDIVVVTGRWGKWEEAAALSGVTVSGSLSDSATTVTFANGPAISPGMVLLVDSEQLLVTGLSDITAGIYTVRRGVNGTTAAAHSNGAAVSRYVPPGDVNYLARQLAGLFWKKGKSQWAGKVGNPGLGEVFYFNDFPKSVIEEIRSNYRLIYV